MSTQRTAQEQDPVATLAEGLSIWVGKLSDLVKKVVDTEPIRNVINWARMYSLWPVNITTACCSAEFGAASGARHDLERFGVLPIGSLRQSDLMVIEGTITKKMAKRLRVIYDQMALPRYIIAMGDCAMSGGLFHDSYSIVNGAHEFVPVDVYVPGCPPRPEALEQAIIMLQEKIRRSKVYEQG
ncbi:MAG TPA: NADH-quinone oxidoreductase subunit NuoB [Candidatus Bathyarchaeia archaeon]|nr:NADH-quinone oxidoreductase subunit NuoB [Candidatus Bathyarchaeia archaeon]